MNIFWCCEHFLITSDCCNNLWIFHKGKKRERKGTKNVPEGSKMGNAAFGSDLNGPAQFDRTLGCCVGNHDSVTQRALDRELGQHPLTSKRKATQGWTAHDARHLWFHRGTTHVRLNQWVMYDAQHGEELANRIRYFHHVRSEQCYTYGLHVRFEVGFFGWTKFGEGVHPVKWNSRERGD